MSIFFASFQSKTTKHGTFLTLRLRNASTFNAQPGTVSTQTTIATKCFVAFFSNDRRGLVLFWEEAENL